MDATGPEPCQITGFGVIFEFYYHSVNSTSHDNPDISECLTILDTSVVFDSIKVNIVAKNPVLRTIQHLNVPHDQTNFQLSSIDGRGRRHDRNNNERSGERP